MDDPSFFEGDLDEEKAKRSILVTDVPENVSPKDVVIHFQRKSNGGGEVVNDEDHGTEHRSSVVITFEDPSIVESATEIQHIIKEKEVTVRRYPVGINIPEIFSDVQARINLDVFGGSVSLLEDVLCSTELEFRIKVVRKDQYRYIISGSYKQIMLSHNYIHRELRSRKVSQRMSSASAHEDMVPEPLSHYEEGAASRSTGTSGDTKIDDTIYQSVPIILEFIFTVAKYATRIKDIESEFRVQIGGSKNGSSVFIRPLRGCTRKKHRAACEEYISVYREVNDNQMMMSKDVLLRPGSEDAVKQMLKMKPVVIQKIDEPDKWLFYGEEADVKTAITEVCKKLNIDNPLRKARKTKVLHVTDEGENDPSAAYSQSMASRSDAAGEEHPGDKGQPFAIETKKGFRMTVYQGDLTGEHVDVIVNSTDKYLSFTLGLPEAIVKQGGGVIEEDAKAEKLRMRNPKPGDFVMTGPGRLHCSRIMHILTKRYNVTKRDTKKESEECKKLVKEACLKCLNTAQSMRLRSIAFPAVGSGQQGMPLDVCAAAMVNAVEDYMKDNDPKKGAITDIRFVHLDPAAVEAFKAELTRRYKDSIVPPMGAGITKRTKHSTLTLPGSPDRKTGKNKDEEDVCPICLDGFQNPVTLTKCNHKFCKNCIQEAFQHRKVCPTCGVTYGMQTGNMPPGTMNHYFENYTRLPGYERCGAIRIDYHFPNGTQGPEHPNPGQRYSGTSRTAYLPDCPEGREVLGLLGKAFNARLTFTIGRSVTTGVSNVVTWNDIHHKTSIYGGSTGFGYPDPTYLKRVKAELAAKGIS